MFESLGSTSSKLQGSCVTDPRSTSWLFDKVPCAKRTKLLPTIASFPQALDGAWPNRSLILILSCLREARRVGRHHPRGFRRFCGPRVSLQANQRGSIQQFHVSSPRSCVAVTASLIHLHLVIHSTPQHGPLFSSRRSCCVLGRSWPGERAAHPLHLAAPIQYVFKGSFSNSTGT